MRNMLVEDKMPPLRNVRAVNTIFAQGGSWLHGIFDEKDFLFLGIKVHTVTKNVLRTSNTMMIQLRNIKRLGHK